MQATVKGLAAVVVLQHAITSAIAVVKMPVMVVVKAHVPVLATDVNIAVCN